MGVRPTSNVSKTRYWYDSGRLLLCGRFPWVTTGARVREMSIPEQIRELSIGLEEIREFYEQMPYPSPVRNLDEHRELYGDPQRRRALFHRTWPTEQPGKPQDILIAGCGTSQAARYALCEPDSQVIAIDISVRSLFYTRDLKRKYGLQNLELRHLPLEMRVPRHDGHDSGLMADSIPE